jgi:hypothetical protein
MRELKHLFRLANSPRQQHREELLSELVTRLAQRERRARSTRRRQAIVATLAIGVALAACASPSTYRVEVGKTVSFKLAEDDRAVAPISPDKLAAVRRFAEGEGVTFGGAVVRVTRSERSCRVSFSFLGDEAAVERVVERVRELPELHEAAVENEALEVPIEGTALGSALERLAHLPLDRSAIEKARENLMTELRAMGGRDLEIDMSDDGRHIRILGFMGDGGVPHERVGVPRSPSSTTDTATRRDSGSFEDLPRYP